ncbi:unnamed protein product [Orchesella dallaii]|uniref:Cell division cycle 5-like protein n=1 Tax=Orchesella dallaii TaxID=48710 RepID=A0ABP1Q309_9HEXA
MPRVMIKGGVWRNTEDEILKAAVMKYGKNQWSRIASLLHRKSAKQCKARWFEWLDPSIKKTEWIREEDQKLLHMAKLMPTQWRTIAPIVGRTAAQCLDRYEVLLDLAQRKDEGEDEVTEVTTGKGSSTARKFQPGEIDPNPENKPARPDPKDMDEDELEMLSEARARLANTQGKKAKRKAREKQLEEARRLASLQKRRELRMAGIDVRLRKPNRRVIDYNREIPFEKVPAPGFRNTVGEVFIAKDPVFERMRQEKLEGEMRSEKEERERMKDRAKLKNKKENELPLTLNMEEQPLRKRSKLMLPQPRVSEEDLTHVVKIGRAAAKANEIAIESGTVASRALLNNYAITGAGGEALLRTPRTPFPAIDGIMKEAQNVMALENLDTPLKGGVNADLGEVDFSGMTPKVESIRTLNTVIASPFEMMTPRQTQSPFGETPGKSVGFGSTSTPFRDRLSINMIEGEGPVQPCLKDQLLGLPEPKNNYEICVSETDLDEREEDSSTKRIEDQDDLNQMALEEKNKIRMEAFKKLSQAVQRDLPRPKDVNVKPRYEGTNELQKAEQLIKEEMITMLHHDALVAPAENQVVTKGRKGMSAVYNQAHRLDYLEKHPYEDFSEEQLGQAKQLLEAEMKTVEKAMEHDVTFPTYTQVWEECLSQVMFVPSENSFKRMSLVPKKDKIESMEMELDVNRTHMIKESKRAGKLEKKVKILTSGYQMKADALVGQLKELGEEIEKAQLEKGSFELLREVEELGIANRLQTLTKDVDRQKAREKVLQQKFSQLMTAAVDVDEAKGNDGDSSLN